MKEKYISIANNNFKGKTIDKVKENIELYYKEENIEKNKYEVGEEVFLKKEHIYMEYQEY